MAKGRDLGANVLRRLLGAVNAMHAVVEPFRRVRQFVDPRVPWLLAVGFAILIGRTWRALRRDLARHVQGATPIQRTAVSEWPQVPKVSVLVAAWNEADAIDRFLRSFVDLAYPEKELVICAGGGDRTYELARSWAGPQVTVLEQRRGEGKQRALRRCLESASGSVIYLTDADCVVSDDAFERLIEPIVRGEAAVVTGVSQPHECQVGSALVRYQWFRDLVWIDGMPRTVDGVLGRNCALLRNAIDKVRAFDQPVATGTDYHLSRLVTRAGFAIRAVPESRVSTRFPESPGAYLRMWRRWNKNLIVHGIRFRAWRDIRGVCISAVLGQLVVLGPVLAPLFGPISWAASVLVLSTACANRLRRMVLGARIAGASVQWTDLIRLPLYTVLDLLAAVLAVRDAADPRLRSRW